jgi:hypothetical protein
MKKSLLCAALFAAVPVAFAQGLGSVNGQIVSVNTDPDGFSVGFELDTSSSCGGSNYSVDPSVSDMGAVITLLQAAQSSNAPVSADVVRCLGSLAIVTNVTSSVI